MEPPHEEPAVEQTFRPGGAVQGGAISGSLAGCAMLLFAMLSHWALGDGFWTPPREVGCAVYGLDGLVAGPGVAVAGLLINLVVSAGWGIVFASLLPRGSTAWTALWTGVLFGIGVWAVMLYGVLPWADDVMRPRVDLLPEWFFYQHLVFGAALLGTPHFRQREAERISARRLRRTWPRVQLPA